MASPVRADFLLSPLFLVSLLLLLVNDLYLKIHHPGIVSGILSDAAGMVFFPILLVGVLEIVSVILPSKPYAKPSWFVVSTLAVITLFVFMKYTPVGEHIFVISTQWLRDSIGTGLGFSQRGLVSDPLDLLALFLAPVPVVFGRRVR